MRLREFQQWDRTDGLASAGIRRRPGRRIRRPPCRRGLRTRRASTRTAAGARRPPSAPSGPARVARIPRSARRHSRLRLPGVGLRRRIGRHHRIGPRRRTAAVPRRGAALRCARAGAWRCAAARGRGARLRRRALRRRLVDRIPRAVVVLLPAAVGLLVHVAVGARVDVPARGLDRAGAVAARAGNAGALRAARRRERSGGALRVALALRVHGLVRAGHRRRAPAPVRVAVLLRRAGAARVRVVPARVRGPAVGTPRGAAVRVAAGRRVVGGERARAAVGTVDRATLRVRAGARVVVGAAFATPP